MNWHPGDGDRVGLPIGHKGNVEYIRADLHIAALVEAEGLHHDILYKDHRIKELESLHTAALERIETLEKRLIRWGPVEELEKALDAAQEGK